MDQLQTRLQLLEVVLTERLDRIRHLRRRQRQLRQDGGGQLRYRQERINDLTGALHELLSRQPAHGDP